MLRKHEIKAIYGQGVDAVAATIRQLYEMIEVEDERVQRLVASASAAHLQRIEQLIGRIARLEEELSSRVRQVHQLSHTVKDLNKQLKEARQQTRLSREAHLAHVLKNAQNSSLPPSTDRRKRTRSLREKSGRKPGGQVGHKGATREFVEKPDHLVIHSSESSDLCGSSLSGTEVKGRERRQVHDLPPQKIEVIEHQAQTKVCVRCGMKNKAEFPSGINAPVQYAKGIRSVVAYLLGYELLPYERCAETMKDLFNSHLSAGTLATIFKESAREMVEPLLLIKEGLKKSEVLGVDGTNLRVKKKQEWVHVSSTEKLTLLVHDKRRGTAAIENTPIVAAARKLVNRLAAKRDEILLFMTDFKVSFDNNQAERDLRMLKVKQKISGCFRTSLGAEEFCRVRSYVSTMKKQGHGIMEAIESVYAREAIMPTLRC